MRLCVLVSSYADSVSDFKGVAEQNTELGDVLGGHEFELHALHRATAAAAVRRLCDRGFDVFLNLCDGCSDLDVAGIEVVRELERQGVPFTGATAAFYDPSRAEMKAACQRVGIAVPASVTIGGFGELRRAESLRFPLIVKHPQSYGSIGLTPASKVRTPAALHQQAERMLQRFHGALIEEFIEGRELSVLVVEALDDGPPRSYRSVEYLFQDRDADFRYLDLKFGASESDLRAACADDELDARARSLAERLFATMQGTGYARCDMRVAPSGEIYLLEINPNCGILGAAGHCSADLAVESTAGSGGRRGFLEHLLRCAAKRGTAVRPGPAGSSAQL